MNMNGNQLDEQVAILNAMFFFHIQLNSLPVEVVVKAFRVLINSLNRCWQ